MSLRMRSPLPSFEGVAAWIGGEPLSTDLAGHPVLVHFWSLSCYLCHETAERVAGWYATYAPRGVRFVAIHQPRSPEELDIAKVETDAREVMKLAYACAVDNEHTIVDRFTNEVVPAFYCFDQAHTMRHFQAGGLGLERIESALDRILATTTP